MPDRRPSPGDPKRPDRPRSDETELAGAEARRARWIAIGAIVVAMVALALVAWRFVSPGVASCQSMAWDAAPAGADLPAGWSIAAARYGVDELTMTLVGPAPVDAESTQPVVYATISCYQQDAETAVTRSRQAAESAGHDVVSRDDLGDQAYTAVDQSGASYVQFRHGAVVADLAASSETAAAELEAIVAAIDGMLGGDGVPSADATNVPTGAAVPSEVPTDDAAVPTEAPAAPELEAALPTSVAGTALTVESALGTMVLADDAGSRAVIAALRAEGVAPEDLQVAQAYDETGTLDLSLIGLRVPGMTGETLRGIVLDTWLAANGPGIIRSSAELGDRTVTKVDYGDGGSLSYVIVDGDVVILIETSDADLAGQVEAALP